MAIIDIKTEITGFVATVEVKPGDKVTEDQPLIMLESMKMQIPVAAPEDGIVEEILVEEEMAVAEGTVVARLKV